MLKIVEKMLRYTNYGNGKKLFLGNKDRIMTYKTNLVVDEMIMIMII